MALIDSTPYKFKEGDVVVHIKSGRFYVIRSTSVREEDLVGSYNYQSPEGGIVFNRTYLAMEGAFQLANNI